MEKKFEQLCAYLSQADLRAQYTLTFIEVCMKFHAAPLYMNNMFYKEFGMSAEEYIDCCRSGSMKILA